MTKEQFEILKEFEGTFTRALSGSFDVLNNDQQKRINTVANQLTKTTYTTCPACRSGRMRFLKRMAKLYFEYKNQIEQ